MITIARSMTIGLLVIVASLLLSLPVANARPVVRSIRSAHGTSCEWNNHDDFYDLCFHSQQYNATHSFTLSPYLSLSHIHTYIHTLKKIEPPSHPPTYTH
jgi:hypothetical protein